MKTETKSTTSKLSHSVCFQRDVMIFSESSNTKSVQVREMTYKRFFELNLSEFTFKLDNSDTDTGKAKTLKKLERKGYTVTSLDDAMYKFTAVKI